MKELVTTEKTGFRVTAQQIAAALTERTKLLVLPYPSNPTGAILKKATCGPLPMCSGAPM